MASASPASQSNQQPTNTYTQGHSKFTIATHLRRTAEVEAAFLIPHLKPSDHILDIGCGPGTITRGLAKYAHAGSTTGIDISESVLETAKELAAEANTATEGPGSLTFEQGNVLERLKYEDESFDVIYCGQLFGHLTPPPDVPLRALAEIRRVLKPGGVLATRDGMGQYFYPPSLDLDRLWTANALKASHKGENVPDPVAPILPNLLRQAGFDADGGKVKVGAGTNVWSGRETRERLFWRAKGQLTEGDPFRQSWLDVGISEEEIEETLRAVEKFRDTEDGWLVGVQAELLAWK